MRLGKCVCCRRELHPWKSNEDAYPISMKSVFQEAFFQYAIEAIPGKKVCDDCIDNSDVKIDGDENIIFVSKNPKILKTIKEDLQTLFQRR